MSVRKSIDSFLLNKLEILRESFLKAIQHTSSRYSFNSSWELCSSKQRSTSPASFASLIKFCLIVLADIFVRLGRLREQSKREEMYFLKSLMIFLKKTSLRPWIISFLIFLLRLIIWIITLNHFLNHYLKILF